MNHENSLDRLLKQWGRRMQSDEADLTPLASRVMRNTRECLYGQPQALTSVQRSWLPRPAIVGWATLGAVAAVYVGAAFLWPFEEETAAPPQEVACAPLTVSPFSPEQIAARKLLYGELDHLFAGTLRWASVMDDGLQFDIADEPMQTTGSPLALRTVITKRSSDGRTWIPVWEADVLLAPDQYVSIVKPDRSQAVLGLWVHRLPDGGYVVHADIGENGQNSGSEMLPFLPGGDTIQTVCLGNGERKYRLSQSLVRLSEGQG